MNGHIHYPLAYNSADFFSCRLLGSTDKKARHTLCKMETLSSSSSTFPVAGKSDDKVETKRFVFENLSNIIRDRAQRLVKN